MSNDWNQHAAPGPDKDKTPVPRKLGPGYNLPHAIRRIIEAVDDVTPNREAASVALRAAAEAIGAPLAAQGPKAQAEDLARLVASACDLVDGLLEAERLDEATPVTDKMKVFLDRRGNTSEDPWWIAKLRVTVAKAAEKRARSLYSPEMESVFEVK
jgi:hypothetical protein